MNYIFDVCLNFNRELYDFFEWNKGDKVEFFMKIPIFRVEDETIDNFIIHNIKVCNLFLKKIYNRSQKYFKNIVKNNKYSCILSSNTKCVAVNFDDEGYIDSKSYLSLEEESEVIEFSKFLKYSIIDYKIIKRNTIRSNYLTRVENKIINVLTEYINDLFINKKYDELEYIYYEIYNEKNDNFNIIKQKLLSAINNSSDKRNNIYKLYSFVSN